MTTSNQSAYVWIWLPNAEAPIVCGKLEATDHHHNFNYGQSYLNNSNAMALSPTELPLEKATVFTSTMEIHHTFADALPDAWGRRVLYHQHKTLSLSLLDMLLLSSSDRIGALHFQKTPTAFEPRDESNFPIEALFDAVNLVEAGVELPKELALALLRGTSIGGARPKATLIQQGKPCIAKFSSSSDVFPIVQAEYSAMRLANKVGIDCAPVSLIDIKTKKALLVERFDRDKQTRQFITSALSLLNLTEIDARYTSYLNLADQIRKSCDNVKQNLTELYRRLIFNILIGNTDDHAKNHSFFWDGNSYTLTPAYDICPYPRVGFQATQAMQVGTLGAYSLLKNVLTAAPWFDLSEADAQHEIDHQVDVIRTHWNSICDEAALTTLQREQLFGNAVLNPYVFYDEP